MLRISEISNSNNIVILKLEGKIIDLWVAELEKQCTQYYSDPARGRPGPLRFHRFSGER